MYYANSHLKDDDETLRICSLGSKLSFSLDFERSSSSSSHPKLLWFEIGLYQYKYKENK